MPRAKRIGAIVRMAKLAGMTYHGYVARCDLGEKFCTKCSTWFPLREFNAMRANRRSGRASYCKKCEGSYKATWKRNLRAAAKARVRKAVEPSIATTPIVPRGGDEYRLPAVNSAVLLYREAMACPKRQARFAEIRARALAAVERADAMELHWQECRAAQGRNRSKPIQVGRGRV